MSDLDTQRVYPRSLTDDIWLLGNYYFNLYLIKGQEKSALIELGVSAAVDAVIAQLDVLEVSPDYLILTHPHNDHFTGMSGLLKKFPQAVLVAAKGARDFVLHPRAAAAITAEDSYISRQLDIRGITPGRPPLDRIFFPEDHLLVDREVTLDLGGLALNCFMVEGHAPGNLAVHIPDRDALVVSDSLGFHYPGRSYCPLFFTGYLEFLATIDRLSALRPLIVAPAHQGPLRDDHAEQAFVSARQAALSLYHQILNDPRDPEALSASLFERYYQDEFTLYSPENISNCMQLLVKRVRLDPA